MTHESEINKQIQERYDKLRNMIYDGPPLPSGLIEKFKVGIMLIPPAHHKFNMLRVKELINKKESELTWLEAGMVINFVQEIEPQKLFITIEETCDFLIGLTDIVSEYNKITSKWNKEIEALRNRLLNTSGIIKSTSMPHKDGRLIAK